LNIKAFKVKGLLAGKGKLPKPKVYCCVMTIEDNGSADLSIIHNGDQIYIPLQKVEEILKEYKYNKKCKITRQKIKSDCRTRIKCKRRYSTLR